MENFDIGDFDADVAVETGGDETSDDVHNVGCCLPVVGGEALHNGVEGVLALVAVDEDAEEEIDDIDEDIGAEDAFPEIPGVPHLSQEGYEEHGSTVAVNRLVETVQRAYEAGTAGCHSIRWCAGVCVDGSWSKTRPKGGFSRCKIGRRVSCNSHTNQLSAPYLERNGGCLRNEENEQVDPHSEVCEPTESLQCSDLANDHTRSHEDNKADNEADASFRDLRDRLAVRENEDGDREQELNCL